MVVAVASPLPQASTSKRWAGLALGLLARTTIMERTAGLEPATKEVEAPGSAAELRAQIGDPGRT